MWLKSNLKTSRFIEEKICLQAVRAVWDREGDGASHSGGLVDFRRFKASKAAAAASLGIAMAGRMWTVPVPLGSGSVLLKLVRVLGFWR